MRRNLLIVLVFVMLSPRFAMASPSPVASSPEGVESATARPTATATPTATPCPGATTLIGGACRPICQPREEWTLKKSAWECDCISDTSRKDGRSLFNKYPYCMEKKCPVGARGAVSCDTETGCFCKDKCEEIEDPRYHLTMYLGVGVNNKPIFKGTAAFLEKCREKPGGRLATSGSPAGYDDPDLKFLCYLFTGVNAWSPACKRIYDAVYQPSGTVDLSRGRNVAVDKDCNPILDWDWTDKTLFTCGEREKGVIGASPISLMWGDNSTSNWQPSFVKFKVDPGAPDGSVFSWYASSDRPLLVRDPKDTKQVTSARQLFGNYTVGLLWADGYEALGAFDQDRDGKLSGDELSHLALWFDRNRDGVSDDGEVVSTASAGLTTL